MKTKSYLILVYHCISNNNIMYHLFDVNMFPRSMIAHTNIIKII